MLDRWLRSLRARLFLALLLPLAALVVGGAALDYRSVSALAIASHDRALAGIAVGLAARLETDRDGDLPAHLVAMMRTMSRVNSDDRLFYLVVDHQGRIISGDSALAAILMSPQSLPNPRFLDAWLHGEPIRAAVYAYNGPDGQATIAVAETLQQRAAEVRSAIWGAATANLLVAGAVAITAVLAVGFALRPLLALGHGMEGHDVRDLRPMRPRSVPTETAPLVRALNRLIQRLRRAVRARQAFINNTAHQLRTPLAGLNAQAELLQQEQLPAPAQARAREIARAVQRLSRLVQQLLSLARTDEDATREVPMHQVQLADVLQETASTCLDGALARQIDLGFEPQPASIKGSGWMLRELLVNLVDNAIAHTPTGATVTARCGRDAEGRAYLEVEDNGPGIPPADRERVFNRFVRLSGQDRQGTGLGLPIVREIAHRHGAVVRLLEAADGKGLRARVLFPA
jgi:two-component system sensor histidine kinase TctE